MYHNRHLLWLTVFIVLVAGVSAMSSLPRLEDPRITTRNTTITTQFPGASAQRVEALVTDKIESALRELHEIKEIESTSRDGMSTISVELQDWSSSSNNEQMFAKIRDKLEDVALELPPTAGKPDFDNQRGASAYTLVAALTWKQNGPLQLNIMSRLAEELADRLRNAGGSEYVRVFGQPEEEVVVLADHGELSSLGLTTQHLANLVAEADAKAAAGALRDDERDVYMEVSGELQTMDRIAAIPIAENPRGGLLQLGDIATIDKQWRQPIHEMVYVNNARAIFIAARMGERHRIDMWTENATRVIDAFRQEFGDSVNIDIVFQQSTYTDERLAQLTANLLAGVVLVMLVVLFFMGWRSSLIVGLALPLTMAAALFSLSFFGEQIHQMSIFGMIVAIGLLIDNAIVMTDEVRKNIRVRNIPPLEALVKAVTHLRVPLFASTFTTILGFMPVFLLPGNVGDFIRPIAISVVMAIAFSFVFSITVIATLAARFTPRQTHQEKSGWWRQGIAMAPLARGYRNFLVIALKYPLLCVLVASLLPISGFILATTLGNVFFPSADRDHFEAKVWLPQDSSIQRTAGTVEEIHRHIETLDGVDRVLWSIGGSIPSVYYNQIENIDNMPAYAQAVVFADSVQRAKELVSRLQEQLDERFPQAQIVVRSFGQGPPVSAPVGMRIYGPDTGRLWEYGQYIRRVLEEQPEITHTQASITGGNPKLWFDADENKVRLAGLTLQQVASQFEAQLEGVTAGSVLEGTEELPVRIRATDDYRGDLNHIASVKLTSDRQERWVPVTALGDIVLRPEIAGITRHNGERVNIIDAFVYPDVTTIDVTHAVLDKLEKDGFTLDPGYRLDIGGDADEQAEAVSLLTTYLPVLLVLMVAVLVLSFRSAPLAALIAVVAILSAGLGMFSLWLSGFPVGFNPLIGSAGLIGVAINGSIVVIAAIRANAQAKGGDIAGIVQETLGCSRHILATTLTTVVGFVPLLMSGGTFWPPLATVIAGGVGFSVMLSLFFTPAAYTLMYRGDRRSASQSPVVQESPA